MKTVISLDDLRQARAQLPAPVGFVPTMGYLHEGHLSLVRQARAACASVVVSIFVNPTQFGPSEDLASYPRNLQRDLALLEEAHVDLVWSPSADEMYPPGFQTWVSVDDLTAPLEGALRPGHFRGVTTVVSKLFNAVQPQKAYFGQKDAQQAAVIGRMVRDLNFPIEIVICPIAREPDGLAMSSRNVYLNVEERQAATVLYRSLLAAQAAVRSGETRAEIVRAAMQEIFDREPLANIQYIAIVDPETFRTRDRLSGGELVLLAVKIGRTRLIDNAILGESM
ncbi:MAG: pantoate--beta-alanine ligase [Chloroflexi bacterium]|nr:pantoate--beta-alanine ligase [Chloroflexota bacterium]